VDRHLQQNVVDIGFGVFDYDIEIAVVVEHARVDQLELRLVPAAPPALLDQPGVGKCRLRIFVEHAHVGVGRGAVEVIVKLLDVLAVVALGIGQPKKALLQDRVAAVPQSEAEAEQQLIVGEPAKPILAPAIGSAARMVVWKIPPRIAVLAVILAHRSPLPLAQIRSPASPVNAVADRFEARGLGGLGCCGPECRHFRRRHGLSPSRSTPTYYARSMTASSLRQAARPRCCAACGKAVSQLVAGNFSRRSAVFRQPGARFTDFSLFARLLGAG
jgi:hypothetical protein